MNINEMTISDYLEFVRKTDRLPINDLTPVLHGLFGEIGGLMTAVKKKKRESNSFSEFDQVVLEELGDAFWYLCSLSERLDIKIEELFLKLARNNTDKPDIFLGSKKSLLSISYRPVSDSDFDSTLIKLGQITGDFLNSKYILENPQEKFLMFLKVFFEVISLLEVDFSNVVEKNIKKISSRFIWPDDLDLLTFDSEFEEFERLPDNFEIEFLKRTNTQQAMRWNGVFVGDPLTDNMKDPDGYRFHDVFHFAHAAILHWSPTFRALIKHKRKSKPAIDQVQDGGRAIVVEEGLTAWIFNVAKENDFFEARKNLTFDMLKNVGQMVKGFEVEKCPLILWEKAILTGYKVFRKVVENEGGTVIGDRKNRTLIYKNIK